MKFDKAYYTTGNYRDYLRRKHDLLAKDIIDETGARLYDLIIDFGCGYGGLVNELNVLGYEKIHGTDISNWAIDYGKAVFPDIANRLQYYNRNLLSGVKNHVFFLDVLEHMPEHEAEFCLRLAGESLTGFVIARIPVSRTEGEKYVLDVSNNDTTHINCHCREWWIEFFTENGLGFVGDMQKKSIYSSEGVLSGKWARIYNN